MKACSTEESIGKPIQNECLHSWQGTTREAKNQWIDQEICYRFAWRKLENNSPRKAEVEKAGYFFFAINNIYSL